MGFDDAFNASHGMKNISCNVVVEICMSSPTGVGCLVSLLPDACETSLCFVIEGECGIHKIK